eukprot:TRINITY_DN862_c0_g3_i1.p1 TRINITY_DN862_c0_g3~~TRINITY_DN862_c0_g3_i1.p1  ORF type:complete len:216 (-),score=47.10 TRINITY_DN862_c0_g3_i1:57-704(-)
MYFLVPGRLDKARVALQMLNKKMSKALPTLKATESILLFLEEVRKSGVSEIRFLKDWQLVNNAFISPILRFKTTQASLVPFVQIYIKATRVASSSFYYSAVRQIYSEMQQHDLTIQKLCALTQLHPMDISKYAVKAFIEQVYLAYMANNDVTFALNLLLDIQPLYAAEVVSSGIRYSLADVALQLGLVDCAQQILDLWKSKHDVNVNLPTEEDEF